MLSSDRIETTKLRVVYDASARPDRASLNDCLYTGLKLNQKICDILIRFHSYRVALTADIEKAFLMVAVRPSDRDALRFLWIECIDKKEPKVVALRFTRVVFGVSSSPFLLNATVRYHLEKFVLDQPDLVSQFLQSLYVDDLVSGADTEREAYELFRRSKEMFSSGSFNLRKFTTNSPQLQDTIDKTEGNSPVLHHSQHFEAEESYTKSTVGPHCLLRPGVQKTLGIHWDVASNCILFSFVELAAVAIKITPTKRNVVSVVSQFYDPLGLVTTVTTRFKIFTEEQEWTGISCLQGTLCRSGRV